MLLQAKLMLCGILDYWINTSHTLRTILGFVEIKFGPYLDSPNYIYFSFIHTKPEI